MRNTFLKFHLKIPLFYAYFWLIDSRILCLKKSDLEQPNSFEKKNEFGSLTFTDFKAYYKAIVIKIVCEKYKEKSISQ